MCTFVVHVSVKISVSVSVKKCLRSNVISAMVGHTTKALQEKETSQLVCGYLFLVYRIGWVRQLIALYRRQRDYVQLQIHPHFSATWTI